MEILMFSLENYMKNLKSPNEFGNEGTIILNALITL